MSKRTVLFLALAAMNLSAQAGTISTWVGGEAGWIDVQVPSALTRAQVTNEFLAFRASPVATDGGRFFGGELGYVFPEHTYAYMNGEWVCTDKIAHNPKPDAVKTESERLLYEQLYPAS